jgi:adenylate cyclase class 2
MDPGRNEEFDEIEVEVSSFEKTREILKRLGFKELARVKKHRLVYRLGDVTFELNRVYSVGDFLDIEVISGDPESAKRKIWETARKLGLGEDDVEPSLYTELVAKE